jgi:hypothetical protein
MEHFKRAEEAAINLIPAAYGAVLKNGGEISLTKLHKELNCCGYGVAARCMNAMDGLGLVVNRGGICQIVPGVVE